MKVFVGEVKKCGKTLQKGVGYVMIETEKLFMSVWSEVRAMTKMLPVGIENFEEIRRENILAYGIAFPKKRCMVAVERL